MSSLADYSLSILRSADEMDQASWSQLAVAGDPFLSRAFLGLAESTGAASARLGWQAMHLALRDSQNSIAAFLPLYLRHHSFGDFSRDWQWAQAWQAAGLNYYPKLVSAVPFTPSPGSRCVLSQSASPHLRSQLIASCIELATELEVSSWQCLFVPQHERHVLLDAGLLLRKGVQFHWLNRQYRDFDDYLATFTADKRKKLKRERRYVSDAQLRLETWHGHEVQSQYWPAIYRQYSNTFRRYGNHPAFSRAFFQQIAAQLGEQMVIFAALAGEELVASAICYRNDTTLFGRHWGADIDCPGLHFELCYYQGIEYGIAHGLQRFEPGAQGEHKLARGFEPVETWSAYWIAHDGMRDSVARYFAQEEQSTDEYQLAMASHLPFKLST
ncbi:GNAT family N-acetyltransferase [Chitinibacter bivalviorum]|uniref:GNAT family N-acetyltransferase n=1 Tax=Chitinibacter bivalviorum TaxID=2739434 RepID=A0A7H9BGM9_9NEIS|nr:GNAT family N-acetyltransferase [Chitinibacter bivalviorum]QLG87767.1 GNAT family N-acetyltransferase [Chitinibacter bivalviorum]